MILRTDYTYNFPFTEFSYTSHHQFQPVFKDVELYETSRARPAGLLVGINSNRAVFS